MATSGLTVASFGAKVASSRRSVAPSFRINDETWLSTVRTEMWSRWPISALVR